MPKLKWNKNLSLRLTKTITKEKISLEMRLFFAKTWRYLGSLSWSHWYRFISRKDGRFRMNWKFKICLIVIFLLYIECELRIDKLVIDSINLLWPAKFVLLISGDKKRENVNWSNEEVSVKRTKCAFWNHEVTIGWKRWWWPLNLL